MKYIKSYHLFENKDDFDTLTKLVWKFRLGEEEDHGWEDDKECFKGWCQSSVKFLSKYLNENGFDTHTVMGYYQDVSDNFIPNMENWDLDEIEEHRDNFDGTWSHWWIVVNNKWIVDITSDQFHPGEEDDYRVVITDLNDSSYKEI